MNIDRKSRLFYKYLRAVSDVIPDLVFNCLGATCYILEHHVITMQIIVIVVSITKIDMTDNQCHCCMHA